MPAFVQQAQNALSAAATSVVSGSITTTTGNLIVIGVSNDRSGGTITSVTDGTNSAVSIVDLTDGRNNQGLALWYAKNITGKTGGWTVNFSGSTTFRFVSVLEISGCDTGAPLDQSSSDNAEAGIPVDCPAVTPSVNGEMIVGIVMNTGGGGDTYAPNTSGTVMTEQNEFDGGTTAFMESITGVQATAASITVAWTASGTGVCICACATFKPAAAAGDTQEWRGCYPTVRGSRPTVMY